MRRYDYDYDAFAPAGMELGRLPRRRPMGMDPNYRGREYRGQRFYDGDHEAAYGRYRFEHASEAEPYGGFRGRYTGAGQLRDVGPLRPSGPYGPPPWRREAGRAPAGGYGSRGQARRYDREVGWPPLRRPPPVRYASEFRDYGGPRPGGSSGGYLRSGF